MYAVFESGGKQHRVTAGETVCLEKLEKGIGDTVVFDKVLMTSNGTDTQIGTPYLEGQTVTGEVVEQYRGEKIRVLKFRRRKHHMKHQGHRQYLTSVKITQIQ